MSVQAQEQQEPKQEQGSQEFRDAFAGVLGGESPAEPELADKPNQQAEDVQPEQPEQKPKEEQQAQEAKPVLAGMTEEQIERLLSKAARVDELEQMVSKAHGKIGEMNRTLLELRKAPPPQAAPAEKPAEDFSAFEKEYPDVAAYVKGMLPAEPQKVQEPEVAKAPESVPGQQEHVQPVIGADRQSQLALMDYFHEGWREKVASDDFRLWLQTLPDETRQLAAETESAKVLGDLVTKFDVWNTARKTRHDNSRKRLEQNLTPVATAAKAPNAPDGRNEFEAAFNSIIKQQMR